jgi:hypothetical protein
MDLLEQVAVLLHLLGEGGVVTEQAPEILAVLLGMHSDLR